MSLANAIQLGVELLLGQLCVRLLHLHVLIAIQREPRQHLKDGLER